MNEIDLRGERWQEVYTKIDLANEIRRLTAQLENMNRGEGKMRFQCYLCRDESARLEEERDALRARVVELEQERLHTLTKHFEQIEEMTYRTDKVEADAKRYRWLREESKKNPDFYSHEPRWMVSRAQGGMGNNYFGEGMDAAIDAAMQEGKG